MDRTPPVSTFVPPLRPESEPDPDGSLMRFEKRLLARIRKMMGPEAREGAESGDVLQSVYADTLAGLSAGRVERDQLLPWMTEVARHKIIDEVRRRREQPMTASSADAVGELATPAKRLSEAEIERGVHEALSRLEPERRRVVTLRCEDGASWLEIARALGRSEEAARKLYHRALLELGGHLALKKLGPDAWTVG
jgi:RNA polymerase sigma factor (sigma-70 family)